MLLDEIVLSRLTLATRLLWVPCSLNVSQVGAGDVRALDDADDLPFWRSVHHGQLQQIVLHEELQGTDRADRPACNGMTSLRIRSAARTIGCRPGRREARWTSSRLTTPSNCRSALVDRQGRVGRAAQALDDGLEPVAGVQQRHLLLRRQELADLEPGQHLADVIPLVGRRPRPALDLRAVDRLLVGQQEGRWRTTHRVGSSRL